MPLCKLHAWFQNVLPTVYDSASLSLYEAMGKVMYKLNEVIDLVNILETNQANVEKIVVDILNKWLDDGTLADIINDEVLNNKADGHVLSVTSFGADPTGVNDSTAAFNQAISKASTDSYKLVVYPGQYKLSSYIFTDYSLFVEDLGTYPDSKLIYCKPLQNRLCSQNYYSFQYQYDTATNPSNPIQYDTQGVYFDRQNNNLYCASVGQIRVSHFDGTKFSLINTFKNENIGHATTITKDENFLYVTESPSVNNIAKFSPQDGSYQGILTLPSIPVDSEINSFCYNSNNNMYFAWVYHQNGSQSIYLYDKNLALIKSFNMSIPQVQQSANWIDNYIGFSADWNWAEDNCYGGMFLYLVDICDESLKYSFPFGNIRAYNECQGFTYIGNGDYIIYSYANQTNIQSFFKFNFKKDQVPVFNTLASTSGGFTSSTFLESQNIVVNSSGAPFPYSGTILENSRNANLSIPVGSDIINSDIFRKGTGVAPFATPQAAAAFAPTNWAVQILLCGNTNYSIAPNGHLMFIGCKSVTVRSITNGTRVNCPPIIFRNCDNVLVQDLYIPFSLTTDNPHNHNEWPLLGFYNCSNVQVKNCDTTFTPSRFNSRSPSANVENGCAYHVNNVSNFFIENSFASQTYIGISILNSTFVLSNLSIGDGSNNYGAVIGSSVGVANNNTSLTAYTYYQNTNMLSNITASNHYPS